MVVQHPRVSFAPRTSIPSQSRRSKPPRALDTQPGTYFWGERHSQTKMVATIGPPTRSEEMIEKMWERGADVFRIPMGLEQSFGESECI
eukprot:1025056-Amorphochlora_amoeboformis.AAC.2